MYFDKSDTELCKDVNLTAGIIFLSAIAENTLLHFTYLPQFHGRN